MTLLGVKQKCLAVHSLFQCHFAEMRGRDYNARLFYAGHEKDFVKMESFFASISTITKCNNISMILLSLQFYESRTYIPSFFRHGPYLQPGPWSGDGS